MGVATSDGLIYDDELQYHLGEPTARITVTKEQPQDDFYYNQSGVTEPFDDQPTLDSRIDDIRNGNMPAYDILKSQEKSMELNQQLPHDDNVDYSSTQQDIQYKPSNYERAQQDMNLNAQEKDLYEYHLKNLNSSGGVNNPDGSRSTIRNLTITDDNGKSYLIPTVKDGKIMSNDEAIANAKQNGLKYYPSYDSVDQAEKRYQQMHDYMEQDTKQYLEKYKPRDSFGNRTQGKNQDRVPQNAPVPAYTPDQVAEKHAQLQIDRTDGETNFLSNEPVKVAAEGSLTDMAVGAYRRFLDALTANADTSRGTREAPRGSLEREGQNTFNREVRRSPADGTFRPADQLHTDWEGFNTVRVRPEPIPQHGDRAGNLIYDEQGQRWVRANSSIGYQVQDEIERAQAANNFERYYNSGDRQVLPITKREHGSVDFETKTGKQGQLSYVYDPQKKDIYIQWMGGRDIRTNIEPHELGIDKTMQIMKAIVEQYPEAKTVTALRAGGARMSHGKNGAKTVTREIPRDRLEPTPTIGSTGNLGLTKHGFGVPGTSVTDLY